MAVAACFFSDGCFLTFQINLKPWFGLNDFFDQAFYEYHYSIYIHLLLFLLYLLYILLKLFQFLTYNRDVQSRKRLPICRKNIATAQLKLICIFAKSYLQKQNHTILTTCKTLSL